jgi:hypothetical protein
MDIGLYPLVQMLFQGCAKVDLFDQQNNSICLQFWNPSISVAYVLAQVSTHYSTNSFLKYELKNLLVSNDKIA